MEYWRNGSTDLRVVDECTVSRSGSCTPRKRTIGAVEEEEEEDE
jgi:hypothetical protein